MKQIGQLHYGETNVTAISLFWHGINVAQQLGHAVEFKAVRSTENKITGVSAWACSPS